MTEPFGKSQIGAYQLAGWENTINVNGKEIKKLGYTLNRSYKDKEGNWKHEKINLHNIAELRNFVTIVNQLAYKGTVMEDNFREIQKQKQEQNPDFKKASEINTQLKQGNF